MNLPIPEPQSPAEMQSLTQDELQMLIAQRNEASSRATLVESLILMGEFEEALQISRDEEQKIWINKLSKAELRDEEHRCSCTSTIDEQDYVIHKDGPPKLKEIPHYRRTYRHYSKHYGKMATFYMCQECNCVQTLPDGMDITELNAEQDARIQDALNTALAKGIPMRRL